MPITSLHKIKRNKNIQVFIIIVGLMALIWAITIFKIREYGVSP